MTYVVDFDARKHRYWIDQVPVPSVTQILGIVDKSGPLKWWAQKVALAGVVELSRQQGWETPVHDYDADELVEMLKVNRLTVNHQLDKAGTRGTSLHAAAELWAKERVVPDPSKFPLADRGWVRSLASFLSDNHPDFLATEVRVGSKQHGYAGTFDAKFADKGDAALLDYKTRKAPRIYDTDHLQLAAYRWAHEEMGYGPVEGAIVVALGPDGDYDVEPCRATIDQFLAVKSCFDAIAELKPRKAKPVKKAVAA